MAYPTMIDTSRLLRTLQGRLPKNALKYVELADVGESGLSIKVDGPKCLTSIGVWPNGCCDVDFLFAETEKGEFRHFEFGTQDEASSKVAEELMLAIERAE